MKIGLAFRNEIMGLRGGSWIVEQFDSLVARISGVWQVEHNDDGTHADVTASSVDVSGNVAAETVTVNDEVTLSATTDTLSAGSDERITAGRATFIQGSIILGVTPSPLLTSQTLLKYAGGGAQGGLAVRRGDDSGAANLSALGVSATSAAFTAGVTIGGTLGVTGDFAINTNKFVVTGSNGNTAVAGNFSVGGFFTVGGYFIGNAANGYRFNNAADTVNLMVLADAGGLIIGSPTGGNKGAGTLNATAVYDDNTLLTDWVFDLYYDGHTDHRVPTDGRLYSFAETMMSAQQERRLPWMPTRDAFEQERSLGRMISRLWFGQEQQQLYLAEQDARLTALEAAVKALSTDR